MENIERSEDVIDNLHYCINLKTIKLKLISSGAMIHFCTLLSENMWKKLEILSICESDLKVSFSKFTSIIAKEKCLKNLLSLSIISIIYLLRLWIRRWWIKNIIWCNWSRCMSFFNRIRFIKYNNWYLENLYTSKGIQYLSKTLGNGCCKRMEILNLAVNDNQSIY